MDRKLEEIRALRARYNEKWQTWPVADIDHLLALIAPQDCGHPAACIVQADEGTAFCGWCADKAITLALAAKARKLAEIALSDAEEALTSDGSWIDELMQAAIDLRDFMQSTPAAAAHDQLAEDEHNYSISRGI